MYLKFKARSGILLNYKFFLLGTPYQFLLMFSWLLDKQTPLKWCYILPLVFELEKHLERIFEKQEESSELVIFLKQKT